MSLLSLLIVVVVVVRYIAHWPLHSAVHIAQRSEVRQRQRLTGEQTARQLIPRVGGEGALDTEVKALMKLKSITSERQTHTHSHTLT